LGPSYDKARAFAQQNGYELALPSREIYLKGCGMIFKGNPKNYVTEIQLVIDE
jgi:effector-binding domain-containing protein